MNIFAKLKSIIDTNPLKGSFLSVAIILAALMVGVLALVITKTNDSPVEQAAEHVLRTQGIDVDLSPDDE